jgi:hypothetical protein
MMMSVKLSLKYIDNGIEKVYLQGFEIALLNSRIQIEQLRHDQVDGIFPVLKITLP